jgi:H/ACA ribonucleoprotein complex subunit 1
MGRGGRGFGGRGGRGGGRGGRGGGRGFRDEGPPDFVVEVGKLIHECESELVCRVTESESKIPHFNAGIYLENKKKIGKIDEVSYSFFFQFCLRNRLNLWFCNFTHVYFYD